MLVNCCCNWLRLLHAKTCGHDFICQHSHGDVLFLGSVIQLRDEGTGQLGGIVTSAHDGPPRVVVGENNKTRLKRTGSGVKARGFPSENYTSLLPRFRRRGLAVTSSAQRILFLWPRIWTSSTPYAPHHTFSLELRTTALPPPILCT